MTNDPTRRTIGMTVSSDYPYNGAEVKREIDDFFTYLWKNEVSRKIMKNYQKFDKIKDILEKW